MMVYIILLLDEILFMMVYIILLLDEILFIMVYIILLLDEILFIIVNTKYYCCSLYNFIIAMIIIHYSKHKILLL